MFEFLVAFRYLRLQKKAGAVLSTAVISVFGISVGVFSLNTVLAVMSGFQTELSKTILGASPHVLVSSYGGNTEPPARVAGKIEAVSGVESASAVVYGMGLLVSQTSSRWTSVTGVDPATHSGTTPARVSETDGRVFPLLERGSVIPEETPILLGRSLAESLGVAEGDVVTFVSPRNTQKPIGGNLRKHLRTENMRVAGIFKYGLAQFDSAASYVHIADANRFFENSAPVSFEVLVEDPMKAETAAGAVENALGFPFVAQSWQEANARLFSAIRLEKLGITVFLGFIVVVASLSVMSALLMMMIEKSRDIAILRAAGATGRQVGAVFVIMGAALGFAGTFAGTAASLLVCYLLADSQAVAGLIPFDPDVYGISKFPVTIEPLYFFIIGVASQLLCVMSAFYPAYCARSGNPAAKLKV